MSSQIERAKQLYMVVSSFQATAKALEKYAEISGKSLCVPGDFDDTWQAAEEEVLRIRSSFPFTYPPLVNAQIPDECMAVVVSVIMDPGFATVHGVLVVFGLATDFAIKAKQAGRLIDEALEAADRMGLGKEISPEVIEMLAKRCERDPARLPSYQRSDVISWLQKTNSNPVMIDVAAKISKALYSDLYRLPEYKSFYEETLVNIEEKNDEGEFASIAKAHATTTYSPKDFAQYSIGRLPESHIRQIAKREVTRKWFRDMWAIGRESCPDLDKSA